MKEKLTERLLDTLPATAKAAGRVVYVYDTALLRFGASCTAAGAISFFVQYRMGGRGTPSKRFVIGRRGVITLTQARQLAEKQLGEVAQGVDVAQARRDTREKLVGLTFAGCVERYLAIHSEPTRYWKIKRAMLTGADVRLLAKLPVEAVTRTHVAKAVADVQKRSAASAQQFFAHLRPVFAYALDQGLIEASPMQGMRGPKPPKARDRVLSDAELCALWQVLESGEVLHADAFKLLILTGQRRGEVAGMRWRELDLDAGLWTIPKDRAKNGKAHTVDLCPQTVSILRDVGPGSRGNSLVLSLTGGDISSAYSALQRSKGAIDFRMKQVLGDRFQPWRIHDLRRTAASGMAALGFQPHVIERVLNHISGAQGGLVSVYQRHEYRDERRRALLAWGEHVAALVGGDAPAAANVVKLRRA